MKEGRWIRKLESGPILKKWYLNGALFKIIEERERGGLDAEDLDGRVIVEINMIMNQFEWVDEN